MRTVPESEPAEDPLETRISAALPSLPPAGVRIVELLAADPGRVAACTITELSALAGTSESTVVRTARSLGFRGYPQLRLALAAQAGRRPPTTALTGDISPGDSLDAVVAKLVQAESEAIRQTGERLDTQVLARVVAAVAGAGRTDLYGIGASGLVARDLQQKLARIRRVSHAHTELHQAVTSAVLLGPGDVAIALSHSGRTEDVLLPLREAGTAGALTVAITPHARSPLAQLADHVLVSAASEGQFRPGALGSRISQLVVADALFIGVAQSTYQTTSEALRITRDALSARRADRRNDTRRSP